MRACKINFQDGEFFAWCNKGVRYALVKKDDGKVYDQNGRLRAERTALAAIEAAMA